ncbi:MAG: flagellar biosynthesis protein FliQ [Candidatus Rifleibacteriota bacterium]
MTEYTLYELFKETIFLAFTISAPILILGMLIGIIVSIFQTATSIQEQSLTFIPKLLITALALIGLAPWMLTKLMQFTLKLLGQLQMFAR